MVFPAPKIEPLPEPQAPKQPIQLLQFQQTVPADLPYKDEEGFQNHLRSVASRALAEKIFQDASIKSVEEEEDWRGLRTRHVWRVAVGSKATVEALSEAEERGRRQGLLRASEILGQAADRYRRGDGSCSYVILDELQTQAHKINKEAINGETKTS